VNSKCRPYIVGAIGIGTVSPRAALLPVRKVAASTHHDQRVEVHLAPYSSGSIYAKLRL